MKRNVIVLFVLFMLLAHFSFAQSGTKRGNQKAFYECKNPLPLDTTLFDLEPGKLYFSFLTERIPTGLDTMNFYWTDFTSKEYFTAYLINASDSTLKASKQDGSLIMIQEALNEDGTWQPIEYWVYSGCGNSYFNPLNLQPNEYLMIPIRKYSGNFETKIRLKCRFGGTMEYSRSFKGSIKKSQFKKQVNDVKGILYEGPASYLDE